MHQRAVDVHLMPEIQHACIQDLGKHCSDQVEKGKVNQIENYCQNLLRAGGMPRKIDRRVPYKHPKNYPYHRMIYPLLICMWGWWRKYYATKTWINSSSVGGDFGPGAEPQLFPTPRNIYQEYQEDNSSPPKHWQQFMTEPFFTGLLACHFYSL